MSGPGLVQEEAEVVGVDLRARDALAGGLGEHVAQHGVAGLAVDEAGEEDVLQAEVVGEPRLEAGGRVGLAAARDVGEVLVVGVEAQVLDAGVAVDDVAGADDVVLRQLWVAVDAEVGAEGDLEADVARGLPVVPDEVVDGGDARGDGAGGEALVDHPAADLGDAAEEHGFRGRERRGPEDARLLGGDEALGVGAEGGDEAAVEEVAEAAGAPGGLADVDADAGGIVVPRRGRRGVDHCFSSSRPE